MMANSMITVKGIPEQTPKATESGDVVLLFRISTNQPSSNKHVSSASSLYCKVIIGKNLWKKVSKEVNKTTYYMINGIPTVNVTSKGLPFLTVQCIDIKAVNGLVEDENSPGSFKFPGELPDGTEALVPITSIIIPEKINEPKTAKVKAFKYFKKHGTFNKPIVVKRDTMTLVSGYEIYLLAKDLNIKSVPVSFNLTTGAKIKDEYITVRLPWYKPEEVTEINVKDIVLTEDIHLNVQNFTFGINLKEILSNGSIKIPVAVRPIEGGKYSLVTGAARYFAAKILDIEKIPAVITDMSREEFVEARLFKIKKVKLPSSDSRSNKRVKAKKGKSKIPTGIEGETPLADIKVPAAFARTRPRPEKLAETIEYYKKHGKFDKPVVIRGDSNLLVDGYKRYVAAKELGLNSIWTVKID
ncbi:MAG TPA: ParB N-terminal domain-containing protein [Clostridiaceae bacterium]|nr:ParB N-terminal domain-containing protein [Clostridiaceae bacterium]